MNTAAPLVSIVTPFYNTDTYLAECIESVKAQSYGHWEYILVNNQSTDRSAEIARQLARTDSRIRVVDTPAFLSQVQNYNFSLQQISSRSNYCKIVQADDWIFPHCISRMVEVGEAHPSTGLISAYRLCGTKVRNVGLDCRTNFFPGREAGRTQLLNGGNYVGSPSSVMLRSEVVRQRQPFYREHIPCEDTAACLEVLKTKDLGFVHQIESFEREDNLSISTPLRMMDPDWLLSRFILMHDYGRDFLTQSEYDKVFRGIQHDYLRFLARNALLCRESRFWSYHLGGMRSIGYNLRYRSLIKPLLIELVKMIGNPLSTAANISLRLRHRG